MSAPRPFAILRTRDQWLRAAHERTYLDPRSDSLELDWNVPPASASDVPGPSEGAGLAFDAECRLYRSLPKSGQIERILWAARSQDAPAATTLLGAPTNGDADGAPWIFPSAASAPAASAHFRASARGRPGLRVPRGLAIDCDDRLFIAEARANSVLVFDLWSQRVLNRIALPAGEGPLDLAVHGKNVYAILRGPAALVRMSARHGATAIELDSSVRAPGRIAASPKGALVVLDGMGTAAARLVPVDSPVDAFVVPFASDIEFENNETLVVARQPGVDFLRFRLSQDPGPRLSIEELPPYKARFYDGLSIVRCPDGSIGFFGEKGFRTAVFARLNYERSGRVCTYRLDSGEYQTQWGRIFLDACIPAGTSVRFECVTLDDIDPDAATLPRTAPAKLVAEVVIRPDLSPPMPPLVLVPADDVPLSGVMHARESGRELPWSAPEPSDSFATYEGPVTAPPGRYLWVFIELQGNTKLTPRVRSLRVEHPSHDLLRRLPRAFSREPVSADFLRRLLALFDGFFGELEGRTSARHALILARATPEDFLPWLAKFIGLALDERWSARVRRTFIEEAIALFRFRGTLGALGRMLEIALGLRPVLVEHFRLRGLGGAIAGAEGSALSSSVVGGGMRVGGQVGASDETSALFGTVSDAFSTRAHRFSVIVPRALSQDELDGAKFILDTHRPAHTLYDICTVEAGMRTGIGLYLGVSSVVGKSGGFTALELGAGALGRDNILGFPSGGIPLGNARTGQQTRLA